MTSNLSAMPVHEDLAAAVAFQRDLYLYWWAAREAGELTLTSRHLLTRATLRRLRGQWPVSSDDRAESDDPRFYYLRRLLERLGLLRAPPAGSPATTPAVLVAADRVTMGRFLAHPLAERLRICTRLWVAGGWWLDGKVSSASDGSRTPAQPRIAMARRRLIETLAALEPGSPVEIPGDSGLEALAPRIVGATATRRKPRDIAEERNETMRAALAGALRWMGLVTRDGESATGERRLLTTCGTLALRSRTDATDVRETGGRVVLQPNLDIVAYQPLTAPALFALDGYATRGAMDRVAHYRLTKADVTRAHVNGLTDADIVRSLEALTESQLPDTIRIRLGDWTRAASRIRLTPQATVLSTTTPAVLDALLADRTARAWVLRRLGPTLALVASEQREAVRGWLLAHGELPTVEHADLTPQPPLI
jgi:Helicase conserved C-terminal domain